jgi:hypothetical protein
MAFLSRLVLSPAFPFGRVSCATRPSVNKPMLAVAVMLFCGACAGTEEASRRDGDYRAGPEHRARLSAQTEMELQQRLEALERQAPGAPPADSGFLPLSTTCQRAGNVLNCWTTQDPDARYFTCRNYGGKLTCD